MFFAFFAMMFYTAAAVCLLIGRFTNGRVITRLAFVFALTGFVANMLALLARFMMSGRLPVNNGSEFILNFAWITVLLFLTHAYRNKSKDAGGFVLLLAACLIGSIFVLMPGQLGEVRPLVPALKSPWLTIHVITAVIAYSGFALTAGLALIQLISRKTTPMQATYRITAFSFVMLTLTIVFGAIWAEQVWGRYWSWDPKETWALITWIIYALFLHLFRQTKGKEIKANLMLAAGFIIVLFTYYGVNYLLPGLHSYS
jgi:ABC-type transport system involved in cytochrome c biogenesis permease subunit